jgi:hypothetical protein
MGVGFMGLTMLDEDLSDPRENVPYAGLVEYWSVGVLENWDTGILDLKGLSGNLAPEAPIISSTPILAGPDLKRRCGT